MEGFQNCNKVRGISAILALTCVAVSAFGQNPANVCPSVLTVPAGESRMIDCDLEPDMLAYEWESSNPSWLRYLSDVTEMSPHFNAPANVSTAQIFEYRRFGRDEEGTVVSHASVSVTVNPAGSQFLCRYDGGTGCPSLDNTEQPLLDHRWAPDAPDIPADTAPPSLHCDPRVTAESGTIAEIRCTGSHPSGGQLTYMSEFDWPPYSETRVLADGLFDYFIRVPLIDEPAAVRILEITASVPGEDVQVSQNVELHIVNRSPVLLCEDMLVQESVEAAFPCSMTSDREIEYQFISDPPLVQRGMYDYWPTFLVPEVDHDQSVPVIVRAFDTNSGHVVEAEFVVRIQNASGPMDFTVDCDPTNSEVYEGAPPLIITCTPIDNSSPSLVWSYSAEGDTPFFPFRYLGRSEGSWRFEFTAPVNVDEDTFYEYKLTATDQADETTGVSDIEILVLDTPQITVSCEDAYARTGDPPLELSCEAGNSRELPLDYQWTWSPRTPPLRLLGDIDATPLFDVPTAAEQQPLTFDYVYDVTVSAADNADVPDLPEASTTVTVTVDKILGQLGLDCVSPLEVYEGDPDVPIECSIQGLVTEDIDVTWTWQALGEDRLREENGTFIFETPESVPVTTTYSYDFQIDAPPHYEASELERVDVIVLKRPILSLNCQDLTVNVGMPPQPIQCEASNDQDTEPDYIWQWDPTTLLSNTDTGMPIFATPTRQRAYSEEYPYGVSVRTEISDPVETTVSVTVINPDAGPSEEIAVSTSELDLGVAGPQGQIWLDPATEQVSGLVYERGGTHSGRMMIRAQSEVTVSIEQLQAAALRQIDSPGNSGGRRSDVLTLTPQWAYSESCVQFAANTQASQTVQTSLQSGDCHVIRIGGTVELEGAEPGRYAGEVAVVVTIEELDQLYSIPVVLTVEAERQVVVLGPGGVRLQPVSATTEALQWNQGIGIQPQVAVLGPNIPSGTFTMTNPSVHSMEVEVSTEFGYRETRDANPFSVQATDELGDLAELVSIHPNVLLLLPGETRQVRYTVPEQKLAQMEDRGYAALFNFTVTSRAYIDQSQAPVAEQSARVTFQAPGVYIPGQGPEQLRATVESRTDQGAVILVETDTSPFYGTAMIVDESGNELGRSELLVYTRSRVRINWNAPPSGELTLRFIPQNPDHAAPSDLSIPAND